MVSTLTAWRTDTGDQATAALTPPWRPVPETGGKPPAVAPPRAFSQAAVPLYVVMFALYSAVGMVIILHYGFMLDDGLARTANASYVLFSRYPHLAAVGFVWNPLPSLAEIPFLAFTGLWPALLHQGLAGTFMAAMFMAGAVVQLYGILEDRGVARWWVWAITVLFALNPMVIIYGGNGMSEAPYLFCTLWAVRRLIRWLHSDQVGDLVVAGLALGVDFLGRYETTGITAAVAVMVLCVTAWRSPARSARQRLRAGLVDAVVVAIPFAVAFIGWALAGWVLTGSAFAQFSSTYGNASQTSVGGGLQHGTMVQAVTMVVRDIIGMELFLPLVLIVVIVLAIRRRELDLLALFAVFGGGIGFVIVAYLAHSTIQNFRYYILVIPFMVLAVALIAPVRRAQRWAPTTTVLTRRSNAPALAHLAAEIVAILLVVAAIPVMWSNMFNPSMDLSIGGMRTIFNPVRYPPKVTDQSQTLQLGQTIAGYLDNMHLPTGSVLVDTWEGYPIVISSDDMHQFVITSDLDFSQVLNDPARYGVRYLLVPDPVGIGQLDALNRRYPTLWRTGAGIGVLRQQFQLSAGLQSAWRLYAVTRHPEGSTT